MIAELLSNNTKAKKVINSYVKLVNKPSPLKVRHKNKFYAKTKDLLDLLESQDNFASFRSRNSKFLLELDSVVLKDPGYRANYVTDKRLLNTWLHSPKAVCAILLALQPKFNSFCGLSKPRYSLNRLQQLSERKEKVVV